MGERCGHPTFLTTVHIVSVFLLSSLLYIVFICILLMISEVKHAFVCLLAISETSVLKDLVKSHAHFSIGYLSFTYHCLYILDIKSFVNIFSFFSLLLKSFQISLVLSASKNLRWSKLPVTYPDISDDPSIPFYFVVFIIISCIHIFLGPNSKFPGERI